MQVFEFYKFRPQVINTPTLPLPHPGGGNFGAPQNPPPLAGGGWGRGIKKEIPIL